MKHEFNIPFNYDFKPYYYGPYSESLTEATDTLIGLGYLKEEKERLGFGVSKYVYELTPSGKQKIELSLKNIKELDLEKIKEYIKDLEEKPTEELVLESKQVSKLYNN